MKIKQFIYQVKQKKYLCVNRAFNVGFIGKLRKRLKTKLYLLSGIIKRTQAQKTTQKTKYIYKKIK